VSAVILHLDHVSFSTAAFDESIRVFSSVGYRHGFIERDVPNPAIKRPFLGRYRDTHALSLLTLPGSIGIEVIDHGEVSTGAAPLRPVFEGTPPFPFEKAGTCRIGSRDFAEARLRTIGGRILISPGASGPGPRIRSIVCPAENLAESARFFGLLGMQPGETAPGIAVLKGRSLMSSLTWDLILIPDPGGSRHLLDNPGFTGLAFITSSAMRERDSFREQGYPVTGILEMRLHGRRLLIFFVTGPSGEPVELIEVATEPL